MTTLVHVIGANRASMVTNGNQSVAPVVKPHHNCLKFVKVYTYKSVNILFLSRNERKTFVNLPEMYFIKVFDSF